MSEITYYERLGLNNDAVAIDIKKGYFRTIRKYPPDKYPNEFLEIRKAYETLSDPDEKKVYDDFLSLPIEVRDKYKKALLLNEEGWISNAINILQSISKSYGIYPKVQILLADLYKNERKTNKAIDVYKELTKEYPDNAFYWEGLGTLYSLRGWSKKAKDALEKSLELDKNAESVWVELINLCKNTKRLEDAHQTIVEMFSHFENGKLDTQIYIEAIYIYALMNDQQKALDKATHLRNNYNKKQIDQTANTIVMIAIELFNLNSEGEQILVNSAFEISPENKFIKSIYEVYKNCFNCFKEIEQLRKKQKIGAKMHKILKLSVLENNGVCDDSIEGELLLEESYILDAPEGYIEEVKGINNSSDILYNQNKGFFELIAKYNPNIANADDKLEYNYLKLKLEKVKKHFDLDEDYVKDVEELIAIEREHGIDPLNLELGEPYVHEMEKVGRNDPCPCGSGKKFKKCCG